LWWLAGPRLLPEGRRAWSVPKNVRIGPANACPERAPMSLRQLPLTLCVALATSTPAQAQFWPWSPPRAPAPQKAAPAQPAKPDPAFAVFLKELWPDAQAKGVTRQTFDLAFAGV